MKEIPENSKNDGRAGKTDTQKTKIESFQEKTTKENNKRKQTRRNI